MVLPEYPDYKESGIDWLGKIPIGWASFSAKRKFKILNGSTPKTGESSYWDGDIVWITPADFSDAENGYLGDSARKITLEGVRSCGTSIVPASSIVVTNRAPIGQVVQADGDLCTNQGCKALCKDANDVVFRFYYYSLLVNAEKLNSLGLGTTFMELSSSALGMFKFPLPPIEEQTQIANFLDYKTAQIDQLIEKKKVLIEKLNEKRMAVITQAVTKGLNPDVPMRDSEVEWLGDVPAHWQLRKLRFLGKCQNGINIGGEHFGSGFPFVSYGDVYNNRGLPICVNGLVESSEEDRRTYTVENGDVFFTRTSETVEEIGITSVCSKTIPDSVFAGFLIRFRPEPAILANDYSMYYFQNSKLRAFFVKEMNLVTRASLSQDLLKNLPVLLPPIDEQIEISNYLENHLTRINNMIKASQKAVSRLTEYRVALITAAVTGKIDVRSIDVPVGD